MPINLTSPAEVASLLQRRGLRPKRRWGQNFLIDANLLGKVVEAGGLSPERGVLEIGPGLGALTQELAPRARRVLAVEIDAELHQVLQEETLRELGNVAVVHADFLDLELGTVIPEKLGPGRHVVVANIPYSVTSPILVRLLEHYPLFERVVLMVQKEVADRLAAKPGTPEYGSLTLFAGLYADVRKVATVSRRAFLPAPEVDSAIIRLDILEAPRFAPETYLPVVHAAFQQRRKSLANALTGPALGWTRERAQAALSAAGIDPGRRGETLSAEEFARLAQAGAASTG